MQRLAVFTLALAACGSAETTTPSHDLGGTKPPPNCTPQCSGKSCGDDGCSGSCGACAASELCSAGQCAAVSDALTVDTAASPHAIHPEIYGVAFANPKLIGDLDVPVNRWGGNATTLYNWKLDVQNIASDWYFENVANNGSGTYGQADYVSSSDKFVKDTLKAGAAVLMTIPTIGWTPKDRVESHPFTCGYPTEKYPNQQSTDPYDAHCGNGKDASGNAIAGDPTNDAVSAPPSFEGDWVQHLVSTFGGAASTGIRYYQLDNEMMLWASTHADVHPMPVSSDEVWKTTSDYAPAIKAADPGAYLLGYTAWNVLDLMVSGLDTANNSSADQKAHGGIPLAQWYLRQLKSYEQQTGTRLIDCLDVHYYPMGGDPLESTRSLWDPTYHDPSWEDQFLQAPIQLLPRMQGWIAAEYPGTDVCVSEYNFHLNNQNDPSAALVEADVLGLFGKYGVRLANFWTVPTDQNGAPQTVYRAFQIYRNYDGAHGHFGDVSVGAASQLPKVAIYAASDDAQSPTRLTVMIINKDTSAQTTALTVKSFSGSAVEAWQVVGNNAPVKQAAPALSGGKIALTLAASSITLLVISK
jgi:hypothetical protein